MIVIKVKTLLDKYNYWITGTFNYGLNINPRMYTQIHTPTTVQGVDGTPPRSF